MKRTSDGALGITIGIGNHKGGVGKSTNAVHLAAALGEQGFRVLIIDLDPTAGSTKLFGIKPEDYQGTLELLTEKDASPLDLVIGNSLYEFDDEEGEGSEEVEKLNFPEGVHLIAARTDLATLDELLRTQKFVVRFDLLKQPLKILKKHYDYIIVDTPPQPGSTLLAAAYASLDWFLLSVLAEPLAVGGLNETIKDIAEVRTHLNKNLEILGVLITRVKRSSSYWQDINHFISENLPGRNFSAQISDTVQVQRLSDEGTTLFQHKRLKNSKVAEEYRTVVKEVCKRTLKREEFLGKVNSKRSRAAVNA